MLNIVTQWLKRRNTKHSHFPSTCNFEANVPSAKEQNFEIQTILDSEKTQVQKSELINIILDSIEKVAVNENQIYIKLKKDLILHTKHNISICDGLNVQLAKLIHLNPNIPKPKLKINTNKRSSK